MDMLGPCEVAAGSDVVRTGKEYPDLLISGGLDKREMAKGKRGRLWSTLYVIPYIRETLVLCHDEAGRLTWRKK